MGLPLRDPSSFTSLTTGSPSPGGPSATPNSDLEVDSSEPSCHRNRALRSKHPRPSCPSRSNQKYHPSGFPNRPTRQRKLHGLLRHGRSRSYVRPAALHAHRTKPHSCWAADADEGCALARSSLQLPGDHYYAFNGSARQGSPRRRSRSCSVVSAGRRPPSLERQDAFRDERTVKRRRRPSSDEHGEPGLNFGDSEEEEVAELYRLGLLYDDEYERGEGFSLDKIVRDEPVYALRVMPARKRSRWEGRTESDFVSLSVDLAFSALGDDEALAGWLVSGSSSGIAIEESRSPTGPSREVYNNPRLTVIYELADGAASAVSSDASLECASVFGASYYIGEDEDESAWAVLDGYNGNEDAAPLGALEDDLDPWVMLGHDGS